jgi:Inositol hexakisphosphate
MHCLLQGMRSIAHHLGADTGSRVVLIDTRQELSIYIAGRPYTRREAEMPTVAMHHAGIHWRELQKLEQWLLEDTCASAEDWAVDGTLRVLVHREAQVCTTLISTPVLTLLILIRRRNHQSATSQIYIVC